MFVSCFYFVILLIYSSFFHSIFVSYVCLYVIYVIIIIVDFNLFTGVDLWVGLDVHRPSHDRSDS